VDEDYSAGPEINEPVRERSNRHGSESSTLEIDVYDWCYALIVLHARNERTNIKLTVIMAMWFICYRDHREKNSAENTTAVTSRGCKKTNIITKILLKFPDSCEIP